MAKLQQSHVLLREVKDSLLPPGFIFRFAELILEQLPRISVAVEPSLVSNARKISNDLWLSEGQALFELDLPPTVLRRKTWYYLETTVQHSNSERTSVLILEPPSGNPQEIQIVANRRGNIREVFCSGESPVRVLWRPTSTNGVFRQGAVAVHLISEVEAKARMLERLWVYRRMLQGKTPSKTIVEKYHNLREIRSIECSKKYDILIRTHRAARSTLANQAKRRPQSHIQQDNHFIVVCSMKTEQSIAGQSYKSYSLPQSTASKEYSTAPGNWIVFIAAGAVCDKDALHWINEYATAFRSAELIYCDHDRIGPNGTYSDPVFKPDWNPELALNSSYILPIVAIRARWIEDLAQGEPGWLNDIFLASMKLWACDGKIIHIPLVLGSLWGPAPTNGNHRRPPAGFEDHSYWPGYRLCSTPSGGYSRLRSERNYPLVTLIIPTRDQLYFLERCVSSILEKTRYEHFEIIIIDNQTTDADAVTFLRSIVDQTSRSNICIRVIPFNEEFNYSRMNNIAVKAARGSFIGFINNDVEVISPEWLGSMMDHATSSEIGAVGAKLLYSDGFVQHAGVVLGIGGVAGHIFRYKNSTDGDEIGRGVVTQQYSAVTAACMVVRKQYFVEVEGFDEENLRIAFNDIDLCLKLNQRGLRNIFDANALLYHHESISRGPDNSPMKRKVYAQERSFMLKRWAKQIRMDRCYNPNLTLENESANIGMLYFPQVPLGH